MQLDELDRNTGTSAAASIRPYRYLTTADPEHSTLDDLLVRDTGMSTGETWRICRFGQSNPILV